MGLSRIKGILVLGISGMGKSSVIKYISHKLQDQIHFKIYQSFNILSKYISGSEELVKKIFLEAKKEQPCAIVL